MKKFIFSIFSIWMCTLLLSSCNSNVNNTLKLSTPVNLQIEGVLLTWDKVDNISQYFVNIEGRVFTTETNSYDLTQFTEPKTYSIKVMAKGDGVNYLDSNWSAIKAYTVSYDFLPISNVQLGESIAYTGYLTTLSLEIEDDSLFTVRLEQSGRVTVKVFDLSEKEIYKIWLDVANYGQLFLPKGTYKIEIINSEKSGLLSFSEAYEYAQFECGNNEMAGDKYIDFFSFTPTESGFYEFYCHTYILKILNGGEKWAYDYTKTNQTVDHYFYIYLKAGVKYAFASADAYSKITTMRIAKYEPPVVENQKLTCTSAQFYTFRVEETGIYTFNINSDNESESPEVRIYSFNEKVLEQSYGSNSVLLKEGVEYLLVSNFFQYSFGGTGRIDVEFEKIALENLPQSGFPLTESGKPYEFSITESGIYTFCSEGDNIRVIIYEDGVLIPYDEKPIFYLEAGKKYIIRIYYDYGYNLCTVYYGQDLAPSLNEGEQSANSRYNELFEFTPINSGFYRIVSREPRYIILDDRGKLQKTVNNLSPIYLVKNTKYYIGFKYDNIYSDGKITIQEFIVPEINVNGEAKTVSGTNSGMNNCLLFAPEEDGIYSFYSEGEFSPSIMICDLYGNWLFKSSNGEEAGNFALSVSLKADQVYYIEITGLDYNQTCEVFAIRQIN